MTRFGDQVLDQALAFQRAPALLIAARYQNLPEDLLILLQIAAGDMEVTAQAGQRTGATPAVLREAAIFYLQQVLFAVDGDSYRVLGVNSDAPAAQIKLNHHWLVRWLHPDRNPDEWESIFADRVNRAWQDLRTPTRRDAYDRIRPVEPRQPLDQVRESSLSLITVVETKPFFSPRALRWLPTVVLSGFALVAVVALALFYKLQDLQHPADLVATSVAAATFARPDPDPVQPAVSLVLAPVAPAASEVPAASMLAPVPTATASVERAAVPSIVNPQPLMPPPQPAETNAMATTAEQEKVREPHSAPKIVVTQAPPHENRNRVVAIAPVAMMVVGQAPKAVPVSARIPEPAATDMAAAPQTYPINLATSVQNATIRQGLIDDRVAASLASRFSQAYANGDIERLMQLFTSDAQNSRGDRQAIADDYRRLFDATARRRIALSNLSWLNTGDSAAIIANFETEVVPRGKSRGERDSGDIRFDLHQEGGELRIYRLRHDSRRS